MPRVLVTGINGFIGSNVALELIKAGYQVRGTIRGAKIDSFKTAIAGKYPTLEVVEVNDIATADLTNVLRGVDSIIHVAVPLPFTGPGPKENLEIAIEGYVNVLRQALKVGISKVVITGSWAATINPTYEQAFGGLVSTEKDWSNVTEEEFLSGVHASNPGWSYAAAKALGEKAAWKFAAQEPNLDLSIIIPPFIFGPYAPGFPLPDAQSALSSNMHIYTLLSGGVPPPLPPAFVDVRDVAHAHVVALGIPKASNVEDKRFLVCGGALIWKDVFEYLRDNRPELKSRLPQGDAVFPGFPGPPTTLDVTRAKEVLNLENYRDWKETLATTVDYLIKAEKTWVKA